MSTDYFGGFQEASKQLARAKNIFHALIILIFGSLLGAFSIMAATASVDQPTLRAMAVHIEKPTYPKHALEMHVTGVVVVRVVVDTKGAPLGARALQAPSDELAHATEQAIMKWRIDRRDSARGDKLSGLVTFYFEEIGGTYQVLFPEEF